MEPNLEVSAGIAAFQMRMHNKKAFSSGLAKHGARLDDNYAYRRRRHLLV